MKNFKSHINEKKCSCCNNEIDAKGKCGCGADCEHCGGQHTMDEGGLWDNIHAKRKRIKNGSGEKMKKPGSKGAPTDQDFKDASESTDGVRQPKHMDPKPTSIKSITTTKRNPTKVKPKPATNNRPGYVAGDEYIGEAQLDELSPETMMSYKKKADYSKDRAANSAAAKILRGKDKDGNRADHSPEVNTHRKRREGERLYKTRAADYLRKALRKDVNETLEPDLDEALTKWAGADKRKSYYTSIKHAYRPQHRNTGENSYDPKKVETQAHLQHAHNFHDRETDKGYDRYHTTHLSVPHHKAQIGHLHRAMNANASGDKAGLETHMKAYHHGNENHKINKTGTYPHAHHLPHHGGSKDVNETFDPKHPKVVVARKATKAGTYNGNVDKNGNAIVHINGKPHTVTKGDPATRNESTNQLDELSPATLKSYKKKSLKQYKQSANKRNPGGGDYGSATKAAQDKHQKRFDKRHKGIGSEIKRTTDSDIHLKDPKGLVRKDPKSNSMSSKPAPYKYKAESFELDEANHSPRDVKIAIGIASDKRYKGGNMTGAVKAMEKVKPGISNHPQVAAVLKRQNEDMNEAPRRKGAPKMTGDSIAIQRAKDAEHNKAMGRTKTGRKKPVRTMTSTQRSLASIRNEEVELGESTINQLCADYINENNIDLAVVENMTEEELNEFIGKAIGGAVRLGAKAVIGTARLAGKGVKSAVKNKQGSVRFTKAAKQDKAGDRAEKMAREREAIQKRAERIRNAEKRSDAADAAVRDLKTNK